MHLFPERYGTSSFQKDARYRPFLRLPGEELHVRERDISPYKKGTSAPPAQVTKVDVPRGALSLWDSGPILPLFRTKPPVFVRYTIDRICF